MTSELEDALSEFERNASEGSYNLFINSLVNYGRSRGLAVLPTEENPFGNGILDDKYVIIHPLHNVLGVLPKVLSPVGLVKNSKTYEFREVSLRNLIELIFN